VHILFPDTIQQQDTVPFFLKANELLPLEADTTVGFGAFEYLPTDASGVLFDAESIIRASAEMLPIGKLGQSLAFPPLIESFFSILLLVCFLLFSLVFRRESIGLIINLKNVILFRNHNTTFYSEQITSSKVRGDFFLTLQTVLITSVIVSFFLLEGKWQQLWFEATPFIFFGVFLIISVFIVLKYLIYKVIGMFFLRDEMSGWIEHYFWFVRALGFLFFIPAIFCIYFGELRIITYILIVIIFFISRVIIIAKLLNIFTKNKIGLFYFIVYLCGTEIAPYILYFKGVFLLINIAGNIII
jgi:hypothetical protein